MVMARTMLASQRRWRRKRLSLIIPLSFLLCPLFFFRIVVLPSAQLIPALELYAPVGAQERANLHDCEERPGGRQRAVHEQVSAGGDQCDRHLHPNESLSVLL